MDGSFLVLLAIFSLSNFLPSFYEVYYCQLIGDCTGWVIGELWRLSLLMG